MDRHPDRVRYPGVRLEALLPAAPAVRVNALTSREEIIDLFSRFRLRLLPVVAGQSGNTGALALAVIMRGLALR